jgi:dynein heavy chain
MMNNPMKFVEEVGNFRGEEIDDWKLSMVTQYTSKPSFTYENMISVSSAAANLCKWANNILEYNRIYKRVKPLMDKASEAENEVKTAEGKLKVVKDAVADINAKVAELQAKLDEAIQTKEKVEAEAKAF